MNWFRYVRKLMKGSEKRQKKSTHGTYNEPSCHRAFDDELPSGAPSALMSG